jgi:hypothetical protein
MLQNHSILHAQLARYRGPATLAAMLFALATTASGLAAPCTGPGAPTASQTACLTAVQIPGNPLRSSPHLGETLSAPSAMPQSGVPQAAAYQVFV